MGCNTTPPITVAEFKDYFDRDFPYSTQDPDTNDFNNIRVKDIEKAMGEALFIFNPTLFDCDAERKTAFMYLTAHYLVIDIANSTSGLAGKFKGYLTSKSVGNVAVGYSLPAWVLNDPILSTLAMTNYGVKFFSLIAGRLVGNTVAIDGRTHP